MTYHAILSSLRASLKIRRPKVPKALKAAWKTYRRRSARTQLLVAMGVLITCWLAANWLIQVARKPTELFFPVSNTLNKSPRETWAEYGPIFRKHSTAIITADLLAALAQAEGAGNPVARTYWRWSFTSKPFEIYKPASSAVGMFQITDGTFDVVKHLCIHNHKVVEDGPWYSWNSCWFNILYSRVIPYHAAEMVSAGLDRQVSIILAGTGLKNVSLQQKQNLAIIIHLCGAAVGEHYVQRKMRLLPHQHCGDQNTAEYLARVNSLRATFAQLDSR